MLFQQILKRAVYLNFGTGKKLLELRDFLKKFTGSDKKPDLKKDLGIWRGLREGSFRVILYLPSKFNGIEPVISDKHPPIVVGMIVMGLLTSKEDPCIPATWQIKFIATGRTYFADEIGTLKLKQEPKNVISVGDVGYLITGIKEAKDVKVGDTLTDAENDTLEIIEGFND